MCSTRRDKYDLNNQSMKYKEENQEIFNYI